MFKMLKSIFYLYRDGFASMKVGKNLWLIIIIKVFIMFIIIKPFFPNILNKNYASPEQKARAVSKNLIQKGLTNGSITE